MILRTFTRNLFRPTKVRRGKPVDIAICIDIECTCDSPVQIQPMELIEIACLKLDLNRIPTVAHQRPGYLDKCPTFHSFVRPTVNPELTVFCQDLTGVYQSTVDKAEPVERVSEKLLDWLKKEQLIDDNLEQKSNFAFASCGNFDLNLLSPLIKKYQFNNDLELPIYFQEWINVKKTFVNHKKEWPKGLYHMLELLGTEPLGRLHSAEDDCKNLARIVECLHTSGCKLHVTSRTYQHRNIPGADDDDDREANNKI